MKFIKSLSVLLLSILLFTNYAAIAKQSLVINKSFAFDPVDWHLTLETGGFVIANQTAKNQFVQIILSTGSVTVFKMVNGQQACYAALGGNSVINSTVCELFPGEQLNVDIDYLPMNDARGTYQIEQANSVN